MIRDAARLLNAKLALDPLIAALARAETEAARTFLRLFDNDIHTVDRAVNSLLHVGPRLSESNCGAAASMAETLLLSAEHAASFRPVEQCGVDGCEIRRRHRHEPIHVRGQERSKR